MPEEHKMIEPDMFLITDDDIMLTNVSKWMQLDAQPFREIRQMLAQALNRSPEDVQEIAFQGESEEIPSDSEWKSYRSTGRQWYTLTFPDEQDFTFVRDQEGVRLEETLKDFFKRLKDAGVEQGTEAWDEEWDKRWKDQRPLHLKGKMKQTVPFSASGSWIIKA